jgi:multiple sugar transport system substrate-binding protein
MSGLSRRDFLKAVGIGGAAVMVAACAPAAPGAAPGTAAGAAAVEAVKKLVVASFYAVDQTAGWAGLVDQFEKDHPGVKVETQVTPWDEYLPKILTQIAADTPPDVLGVENTPFIQFVRKNVLLDLTPLLEADQAFKSTDFFPKLIGRYTVDGKVWGIPYDVQPICCLFYNKDHFDKAGVTYPTNEWKNADLLAAAQAMTKSEGDRTSQYGFHLTETAADRNLFVYSNGGTVADSVETPTKATFNDPKTVEGMQFWSDLIHTHKVAPSPGFFKQGGMGGADLFATGRLAMFIGGYWELVFGPDKFSQVPFGMQIAPAGADGTRGYATGGTAYCASQTTKNQDTAWEFIKYFMGMPGYEAAFAAAPKGIIYPPAYIPAYNSKVYLKNPTPPVENLNINGDAAEYAWFTPHHEKWVELRNTVIIPETELVGNGEKTVEEALAAMQTAAEKAFAGN